MKTPRLLYRHCQLTKSALLVFVERKDGNCWKWKRSLNTDGYGTLCVNGKSQMAHRIFYQVWMGRIPKNLLVCHHCDNPACCNPKHLFLGTQRDNVLDCIKKGRFRFCFSKPGELGHNAKLTAAQVRTVRKSKWRITSETLGKRFGVTASTIKAIWQGLNWRTTT